MKLVIFKDSSVGRLRMERADPLAAWTITLPGAPAIICDGGRDRCIALAERQLFAKSTSMKNPNNALSGEGT